MINGFAINAVEINGFGTDQAGEVEVQSWVDTVFPAPFLMLSQDLIGQKICPSSCKNTAVASGRKDTVTVGGKLKC